jgi:hypothetical protein
MENSSRGSYLKTSSGTDPAASVDAVTSTTTKESVGDDGVEEVVGERRQQNEGEDRSLDKSGSAGLSNAAVKGAEEGGEEMQVDSTAGVDECGVIAASTLCVEMEEMPTVPYDYDAEFLHDPAQLAEYARDIFIYYRSRELGCRVGDYLGTQRLPGVTRQMRAILVDWMVEIQENFELNHETLYLAVKMCDLFLDRVQMERDRLQLTGAVALFISSKYEEKYPPVLDDFLYICDEAYSREVLLQTEQQMLRALNFDVGYPLSYRFLRRYAKTTKTSMEILTLARYILETSLMHYEFVRCLESKIAAAAFLLALRMKKAAEIAQLRQTATELPQTTDCSGSPVSTDAVSRSTVCLNSASVTGNRQVLQAGANCGTSVAAASGGNHDGTVETPEQTMMEDNSKREDIAGGQRCRDAAAEIWAKIARLERFEVWTPIHIHYSGYCEEDLEGLVFRLNRMLLSPAPSKTIKSVKDKYVHEVFLSVALIPPLPRAEPNASVPACSPEDLFQRPSPSRPNRPATAN